METNGARLMDDVMWSRQAFEDAQNERLMAKELIGGLRETIEELQSERTELIEALRHQIHERHRFEEIIADDIGLLVPECDQCSHIDTFFCAAGGEVKMSWHPEDEGHQRALNEWWPTIEALRRDRAELIEVLSGLSNALDEYSENIPIGLINPRKQARALLERLEGK
jgi:hypothetical protein